MRAVRVQRAPAATPRPSLARLVSTRAPKPAAGEPKPASRTARGTAPSEQPAPATASKAKAAQRKASASPRKPRTPAAQTRGDVRTLLASVPPSEFSPQRIVRSLTRPSADPTADELAEAPPAAAGERSVDEELGEEPKWLMRRQGDDAATAESRVRVSAAEKQRLEAAALESEAALVAHIKAHCDTVADAAALLARAKRSVAGADAHVALVRFASGAADFAAAERAFAAMGKAKLTPPASAYNALIYSPDPRQHWADALRWYRALLSAGHAPSLSTLHAVAHAARKDDARYVRQALDIASEIVRVHRVQPTGVVCEALLKAAIHAKQVGPATAALRMARNARLELDAELCEQMVRTALRLVHPHLALEMLDLTPYVAIAERTLCLLLDRLTALRDWPTIAARYERYRPRDAPPSLPLLNRLLRAAAVCRVPDQFEAIEKQILDMGYTPDADTYNARLTHAMMGGTRADLEAVLQRMDEAKVERTMRTYSVLLEAAAKEGDVARAMAMWDELAKQEGVQGTSGTRAILAALTLLGRPQHLDALRTFVASLVARIRPLSAFLHSAVVDALSAAGDTEAALHHFFDAQGHVPRAEAEPLYVAAIRTYERAGDVAKAVSLFEERRILAEPQRPSLRLYAASPLTHSRTHRAQLPGAAVCVQAGRAAGLGA